MSDRTRKLVSIRRKTDQDLLVLVSLELERGMKLVGIAADRVSPVFARAEKAHSTALALLYKISGLERCDRQRLESGLKELRFRLDRVPALARPCYLVSVAS